MRSSTLPLQGDVVTFSYHKYANVNLPVRAVVERIRKDVSWEEVVQNYWREAPKPQVLNGKRLTIVVVMRNFALICCICVIVVFSYINVLEISHQVVNFEPKVYGYYAHAKRKQIRQYFEKFASAIGFDALVADNWYYLPLKYIKEFKVKNRNRRGGDNG